MGRSEPGGEGAGEAGRSGSGLGRELSRLAWAAARGITLTLLVGFTLSFSWVLAFTVYRSYFSVPDEVEVPAIQGREFLEAARLLEGLGLRLRVEEARYTSEAPRRVVLGQDPPAGRRVREDREIAAVVSLGPEEIEVPDLRGLPLREARIRLARRRLSMGAVKVVSKEGGRADEVVSQEPAPGQRRRRGGAVDLAIHRGGEPVLRAVPEWSNLGLSNLQGWLDKAGLSRGSLVWSVSERVPEGRVFGVSPPAGAEVAPGAEVEFDLSAGPLGRRLFKQRQVFMEVPSGSGSQVVRIVVDSRWGRQLAYRGEHLPGATLELLVSGPEGAWLELFVNEILQGRERL